MKLITNNSSSLSILLLSLYCSSAHCMKMTEEDDQPKTETSLILRNEVNSLPAKDFLHKFFLEKALEGDKEAKELIVDRINNCTLPHDRLSSDLVRQMIPTTNVSELSDNEMSALLSHLYFSTLPDGLLEEIQKRANEGHAGALYNLGEIYYFRLEHPINEVLELWKLAADKGHTAAQFWLGAFYSEELSGIEKDYNAAFKWLSLAARSGHTRAQIELGDLYLYGRGVDQDYKKALDLYRLAANQGNEGAQRELSRAIIKLGDAYLYGQNGDGKKVEQDYKEALKYYRIAAELGHEGAQHKLNNALIELGDAYLYGKNVGQDYKEALKYYGIAKELGIDGAQHKLDNALMELGDEYSNKRDYKEALKCYELAKELDQEVSQDTINKTLRSIGYKYEVKKDYKEAIKYYTLAVEQGDTWAQIDIGDMYLRGKGVEKDYKEALRWFDKAGERGRNHALRELKSFGKKYLKGSNYHGKDKVEKDYQEALKCYILAADLGGQREKNKLNNILYKLGNMYLSGQDREGQDIAIDYSEALKYYRQAAENGYVDAQNKVGDLYSSNQGIPLNYDEALKWYELAAAQSDMNATWRIRDILNKPGKDYLDKKDYKNAALIFFENVKRSRYVSSSPLRRIFDSYDFTMPTNEQIKIAEIKEDLGKLKEWLSDRKEYYRLQSASSIGGFKETFGKNPYLKTLSEHIVSSCEDYLSLLSEMGKEEPGLFIGGLKVQKYEVSEPHNLWELSLDIDGITYFSFTPLKLDMLKTDGLHEDVKKLNVVYFGVNNVLERSMKIISEKKLSPDQSKLLLEGTLLGASMDTDKYDFLTAVLDPYFTGRRSLGETRDILKIRMQEVSEDLNFVASLNHDIKQLIKITAEERYDLFMQQIWER